MVSATVRRVPTTHLGWILYPSLTSNNEIKWSDRYASDQPGELRGLIEFAKRNFDSGIPAGATTKTITAENEIDGVLIRHFPCSLHCYRVGKNIAEGLPCALIARSALRLSEGSK